jgi:hypothetical protein
MEGKMAVSKLQNYIEKYGPVAGPKLYHALQSRAAYIGANSRRRRTIAGLTGTPTRIERARRPSGSEPAPLLIGAESSHGGEASSIDFREAEEIM